MTETRVLSESEFNSIAGKLLDIFDDEDMSIRDAVRVMMIVAIENCIAAAPSFSVGLAEITKLYVQALGPSVQVAFEKEFKDISGETNEPEV